MKYLLLTLLFSAGYVVAEEKVCQQPKLLEGVSHRYPMPTGTTADLKTCHEGVVEVSYIISEDGNVEEPQIVFSSLKKGCRNQTASEDFFHESAIAAILQFKYEPSVSRCRWTKKFKYTWDK